jgi:hypothetical protein
VAGLPKNPQLFTHSRGAWHLCSSAMSALILFVGMNDLYWRLAREKFMEE